MAAFASAAPNADAMDALFDIDLDRFDQIVQYLSYVLDNGVTVYAPFAEIGESVIIAEDNGEKYLTVRGRITREAIRTRGR